MTACYVCDSFNITLCFDAVNLFTKSPEPCSYHSPMEGCLDWLSDQLWPEGTSNWSIQQGGGGQRDWGGNCFLHWRVSSPQFSSLTPSELLSPGPGARALPGGSWSDRSQYRSCFGMASMPSIHLKKKEMLLSKQEYPHQAGLQPNGGWFSSSLAAKFL